MDESRATESHGARVDNIEREQGEHARRIQEHDQQIRALDRTTKTLADGLARNVEQANKALRQSDEAMESYRMLERVMTRAMDGMAKGTKEHLLQQDEHLKAQDRAIEEQGKRLEEVHRAIKPMSESVTQLVKIEERKAIVREADDKRRAETKEREDALKRRLGIFVAIATILAMLAGFVGWASTRLPPVTPSKQELPHAE